MAKTSISHQQAAFIRFELNSNDAQRQKSALQDLCRLSRAGLTLRPEIKTTFEQMIAGLTVNASDLKVVRWALNAIARIGTVANTAESAKLALRRHEADPEIVAAAVSALASLHRGRLPPEAGMAAVDPATRMLAAMQTVAPRLLDTVPLSIDLDTADPELLKLALIVIGLNRDIQHLLHPRHENGEIVRALGQHDDPIVRQYSVWSVIENDRLGAEHLGVPLDSIDREKPNVQAKLLQLAPTAIEDRTELQELIIQGSILPSLEAREGLAKGLSHLFYEGLQDVTIRWAETETEDRVLLPLAEHFARHAEGSPSYREEALMLYDRGKAFRERVRLGAEGTALYSNVRGDIGRTPSLFDEGTDTERRTLMERMKTERELRVLILNATPDPAAPVDRDYMPIRPDKEAMELRERMAAVQNPRRRPIFETVYATRVDQIQQEMVRHDPKVLHFSGHGGGGSLVFEDRDGRASPLDGEMLARIVETYGELECLVLHACYSDEIAKACAAHVPYVVGSTDAISDFTAPKFTYMFYQAIATGRPYRQAFEMGRNEVALVDQAEATKYAMRSL
ncbi:CHAT domain-containing protein [Palleronia abyssalis]|uniref:CHAT domain-containing protein n=1 Tax=Palleronia abyssalis TaxID=1501240 RepID=A0A2R8BXZ8_9RHOB|nr:CHAT domain-containing protein [Palleronia abyssalis]SPJ25057.1 hypothetical protein PAA8504_02900 [Palleronia abyssalis]